MVSVMPFAVSRTCNLSRRGTRRIVKTEELLLPPER